MGSSNHHDLTPLRGLPNPFTSDRIDHPFEVRQSDLHELNHRATLLIESEIHQVRLSAEKKCRGVLVLGEAGTGKTHLLSRIYHDLGESNHLLFVPRPSNPDGVLSFIWMKVLESLDKAKVSSDGISQWSLLLREAFLKMLRRSLQLDTDLGARGHEDWERLLVRIAHGETLGEDLDKVRNRICTYYASHHHRNYLQDQILRALVNLLFYTDPSRRRKVFECLNNYEVDEEETAAVALKPWRKISEDSSHTDLSTSREQWALEALRVISELASYGRPLILAFDQLEGLANRGELTRQWGHALQEIMTHCQNIVVVCCIFPNLWKEWFTKPGANGYPPLEEAVVHRIAARVITLDTLSFAQASSIASDRIVSFLRMHRLDTTLPILPREKLHEIWDGDQCRTPRRFIQRCRLHYDRWILGKECESSIEDPLSLMERKVAGASLPSLRPPEDSEWVARLGELIRAAGVREEAMELLPPRRLQKRVLPDHIVLRCRGADGDRVLVIGYCNRVGNSFVARLRNWGALMKGDPSTTYLLIRSEVAPRPSSTSASGRLIRDLQMLTFSQDDERWIYGVHSTLIAIEEEELLLEQRKLSLKDFGRYMREKVLLRLKECFNLPLLLHWEGQEEGRREATVSLGKVAEAAALIPRVAVMPPTKVSQCPVRAVPPSTLDFSVSEEEVEENLKILRRFVRDYDCGVDAQKINAESDVITSPHTISILVDLLPGVYPDKLSKNSEAASLSFKREVRIVPVIERGKMCFEIERRERKPWSLLQALPQVEVGPIPMVPLGIDTLGRSSAINLFDPAPGLLVGGSSGSGKSNFLNSIIGSLVLLYGDDTVNISIGDVKQVDFQLFEDTPITHVERIENDEEGITDMLASAVEEMECRYKLLKQAGFKKWSELRQVKEEEPYRIILIDELADLLLQDKGNHASRAIQKLAQKGRAAGITLILASQHPKDEVLSSLITVNLNNRVAFKLQTYQQSRVILGESGAEKLLGAGDCLVKLNDGPAKRYLVPHFDAAVEQKIKDRFKKGGSPSARSSIAQR